MNPELIQYHVPGFRGSPLPGSHRARFGGVGALLKHHIPWQAGGDPRRIDLRASALDVYGRLQVRQYYQPGAVAVYLLADLSGSMEYGGKKPALVRLLLTLAYSAAYYGDPFGFVGVHEQLEPAWFLPPGLNAGRSLTLARRLERRRLRGQAPAFAEAPARVAAKAALVFIVSDFNWPEGLLDTVLSGLKPHAVVSVVLWDKSEYQDLPEWGLFSFRDPEQEQRRATVFMRPGFRQKILAAYRQRRQKLQCRCRRFGFEPLFLHSDYDPDAITRYFQQRCAGSL